MKTLIAEIACVLQAVRNTEKQLNTWAEGEALTKHLQGNLEKHQEHLRQLANSYLPRGSGFDAGTDIVVDSCTDYKVVLRTSFHHMNDNGYYTRWTEHKVIVTPAFDGFDINIKVTGRNHNDIKDYIGLFFFCQVLQEESDRSECNPWNKG